MSVFYDIDLKPACEHKLVKTLMITKKCCKCKQFKWPWSKAVGCIRCMKVWHRECRPDSENVKIEGQKCVLVETRTDELVPDENSVTGVVTANRTIFNSPRLQPVGTYHKVDLDCTSGMCLEWFISRKSSPIPMHPIKWPKRLTQTFPVEDVAKVLQAVETEKV